MTPIIVGDTGYGPKDLWEDNELNYFVVTDEEGREIEDGELSVEEIRMQLGRFLKGGRQTRIRRPRSAKNGDQSVRAVAQELGYSTDTVIKIFQNQKGVIKRTFSGRNRKKYTILKIPRSVVDRWRQEHTIK
jgi:hypothetical protein